MKKFLCMLLALVMALSLVACGEQKQPDANTGDGDGDTTATGSVYYLNFKPESDAAWQTLAAAYTAETGVPVKVVTAASGQYDTTLTAEMDKDTAPTMFQVGNLGAVNSYGEFCYNLEGTDVYNQMTTHDFDLKNADGETVSIGYCYEAFGIIVNKALLEKAGHSLDEITNFESLKAVADDIHARASELGFDAFTSAGLDGSSAWRFSGHLANMPLYYEFRDDNVTAQPATIKGTYLDNYKAIWDLYTTDSATTGAALLTATGDQAEAEFGEGKAAFYQNGTWAWTDLQKSGMKAECVGMIPIYIGAKGEENQGLATASSENCLCVNAKASEADQKASKDFLNWVVTSDEGIKALSEDMGFTTPFKTFDKVKSDNPLVEEAVEDSKSGKQQVAGNFTMMPSEEWQNQLGQAMLAYAQGTGSWDDVRKAFVDNWKTEYDNAHANQ